MRTKRIEITTATILKFLGIIIALVLLWYLKSILMLLFVVLIIVASLAPVVDWGEKYKIPRILSTIVIYLLFLGLITLLAYLIIPPLVNQIVDFANQVPKYISHSNLTFESLKEFSSRNNLTNTLKQNIDNISRNIISFSGGLVAFLSTAFGGVAKFIIALALIFYLLLTKNQINQGILSYIPKDKRNLTHKVWGEILRKLGSWARGQTLLCFIIGILSGMALWIIGVPYALVLGVFAGLTELIPNIGPIIGAIPAIIIAYTLSPVKALIVAIVYLAVQQLENHVLVPNIMRKAVGINPAIIIIAVLVGAELAGTIGIILAVPTAAVLSIVLRVWKEQTIVD
jgi:predicted PurR-regulated permease PerM